MTPRPLLGGLGYKYFEVATVLPSLDVYSELLFHALWTFNRHYACFGRY